VHGEGVYERVLGLPPVNAVQALADLVEISSQIESAVLAGADGTVLGSTLADPARAEAIAGEARGLLEAAAGPAGTPSQIEVSFHEGCVFVVTDGERLVAAVTGRDPTAGLVFYDLKTCLRLSAEPEPAGKAAAGARRRKRKPDAESGAADEG
jgi:predicted regulator of Ras-like GTPase activity (Roadblock/LC7/MglB family)